MTLTVADHTPDQVRDLCRHLAARPAPDPLELARLVPNKKDDKFDKYLPEPLLDWAYASRNLDVPAAREELEWLGSATRSR